MPSSALQPQGAGDAGGGPAPRRPRFARALAYAYVAAGVVALLAELGARTYDLVYDRIPFSAVPDVTYDLVLRDSLGPRGRPNGHFQKWRLNSAGFRSPETVVSPVPNCRRVMTLGSSETFGSTGEGLNKEYPAQLSDTLNRHGCYQVLNAAIVGMSIRGIIASWNNWGSHFRPDFAVILANPTMYLGDGPPTFPPPAEMRSPPWWTPRLVGKAKQLLEFPDLIQHWRVQRQLSEMTSARPEGWLFSTVPPDRLELFRHDVDSLITTIRAHGARPVLVAHPMRVGTTIDRSDRILLDALRTFGARAPIPVVIAFDSAANAAIHELGQRTSTPVVDLPRVMNGRHELFDDAVHFTNDGSAVVAREVSRAILNANTPRN